MPSLVPWNDINLYFDENEPNIQNPNPLLRKKIGFVNHESNEPAIKFLGIYLDPALNFKFHIDQLNKKLSKSLYCMRRCKNILTKKALLKNTLLLNVSLSFNLWNTYLLMCLSI